MTSFTPLLENARAALLAERNPAGHWQGELSRSALSTATAVIALDSADREAHRELIAGGLRWLREHQNEDGGWGDTVLSVSNISTTLLCWSALGLTGSGHDGNSARAEKWIEARVGSLQPEAIVQSVKARYGRDRTFAAPILMACAIGGRLGSGAAAWRRVLPLPFELAVLPRKWFGWIGLPVVSYALPALIAIGYARFFQAPPVFAPWRRVRKGAWPAASRLLLKIQPTTGGYIEATPLTSFVVMALASADQRGHQVVSNGVRFLAESVRADGSWPIDTNLATWVTTLAVKALGAGAGLPDAFTLEDRAVVREWLLAQQYREVHLYTNAPPGGWAWTDLSGGVPDADDTPGALLALKILADGGAGSGDDRSREAVQSGVRWLLDLQNRDGGIPTFCRGWGKLPFDRSSPDLTAHVLRAWEAWKEDLPAPMQRRVRTSSARALKFLRRRQEAGGAWAPLWFGNQHVGDETNRTYGTSKVLLALATISKAGDPSSVKIMIQKGARWLADAQNPDGGWGAGENSPSSIEETALATEALARAAPFVEGGVVERGALERALAFLEKATDEGTRYPPSPIGFYFAKLWYYEKLYPLVWTVSALESLQKRLEEEGAAPLVETV